MTAQDWALEPVPQRLCRHQRQPVQARLLPPVDMKIQGKAMAGDQSDGDGKSGLALGMPQTPRAKAAAYPCPIGTDARSAGRVDKGNNLGQATQACLKRFQFLLNRRGFPRGLVCD